MLEVCIYCVVDLYVLCCMTEDNVLWDYMDCVAGLWIVYWRTVFIVSEDCMYCVGGLYVLCCMTVDNVL